MKSMTGFGKSEFNNEDYLINIEIKSVNHRYFEVQTKLNRKFLFLEDKIKLFLKSKIKRGKVDVFVDIKSLKNSADEFIINESLAQSYINAAKGISEKFNIHCGISADKILKYEGVAVLKPSSINEDEFWETFKLVLNEACENLVKMRLKEGKNIKEDIQNRAKKILKIVDNIEQLAPKYVEAYEEKIKNKLKEILENQQFSEDRILTEAAILADKTDISEEISRIRSHFKQFFEIINTQDLIGRKLDFLIQEVNREANTMGSKAMNSDISACVIEIKSEVEKIREQVQNVQ